MARKERSQKKVGETVLDIHYDAPFEPSYVYTILKNSSASGGFSEEGRQEDAEEFLSCLLNGISDEMLEVFITKQITYEFCNSMKLMFQNIFSVNEIGKQ